MQGRFEVALHRVGRMTNDQVLEAIKTEGLDAVLGRAPRELHCPKQHNLVQHWIPAWLFSRMMSGPGVPYPFYDAVGAAGLGTLCMMYLDTEPTYTELFAAYWSYGVFSYQIRSDNGTDARRFIDDHIEDHRIVKFADAHENPDSDPKESILFRERFLFLPADCITVDGDGEIASIAYMYSDVANSTTSRDRGTFGRVRLRDDQGRPVKISKTAEHVLLVEFELELVTI